MMLSIPRIGNAEETSQLLNVHVCHYCASSCNGVLTAWRFPVTSSRSFLIRSRTSRRISVFSNFDMSEAGIFLLAFQSSGYLSIIIPFSLAGISSRSLRLSSRLSLRYSSLQRFWSYVSLSECGLRLRYAACRAALVGYSLCRAMVFPFLVLYMDKRPLGDYR